MFTDLALEQINTRKNWGKLPSATHVGVEGSPGNGPYAVIHLEVADGVIRRASYETNGCPTSIASCGLLVLLITGRPVENVLLLTPEELARLIGDIPEGKGDCPPRAVAALRSALIS